METKMYFSFKGEGKYKNAEAIEVNYQNINVNDSVMFNGGHYKCVQKTFNYHDSKCSFVMIYLDSGKRKFSI